MGGIGKEIRTGIVCTLVLAILVCGIYPMIVWGIAQAVFPAKANGSLIIHDGKIVGSRLMAQGFSGAQYFHPRPSAAGAGYDPLNSGGSNLGPLSKKLVNTVRQRTVIYRHENNVPVGAMIPADAVTVSASGLDPHISPENALLQVSRVAKARGLNEEVVRKMVWAHTENRDLGILGEPRVDVLMLNLDLDRSR